MAPATFLPFLPFLVVPAVLAIIALSVYWQLKRAQKLRESFKALAPRLGMAFIEGQDLLNTMQRPGAPKPNSFASFLVRSLSPWRMEGQRQGTKVSIFSERRGSGKNSTVYTIVRAEHPEPAQATMRVYPEGGFEKFTKSVFNLQDVQIGEEHFDKSFMVEAADPVQAKLFLTPERRERLLAVQKQTGSIVLTDKHVQFEKAGLITDEQKLRSILDAVVSAAIV